MYGPDLLIAPVLQSNVTKQRVYLPKGEWVFMWNNATIVAGGQYGFKYTCMLASGWLPK
jgi:alpha-glucosidase (family GH31 glycosyl hydrolase)